MEDNIGSDDELFEESAEEFDAELDAEDPDPSDKIPEAADDSQALQNHYLNLLRKEKVPVLVYLVNGVKLQGVVESFDQYVVLLRNTSSQMIYKHAISTIVPVQRGSYPDRPERSEPRGAPDFRGGGYGGHPGGSDYGGGGGGGYGGRRQRPPPGGGRSREDYRSRPPRSRPGGYDDENES